MIVYLFPVLGVMCLWQFLKNRVQRASMRSLLWKTGTSICFLAVSFAGVWFHAAEGREGTFSLLVTAGLFFGLLGDIWLDLKWNCPSESDGYMFAGFWCFAAGHVLFLIALIGFSGVSVSNIRIIITLILAAVIGIAVGMGGKLLALEYGRFKNITMLYGALLIGTTLVSGNLLLQAHGKSLPLFLFFTGAVLFLISDLILSGTYFGKGKDRPKDIIANHICYYAAQFLIAFAAVVI